MLIQSILHLKSILWRCKFLILMFFFICFVNFIIFFKCLFLNLVFTISVNKYVSDKWVRLSSSCPVCFWFYILCIWSEYSVYLVGMSGVFGRNILCIWFECSFCLIWMFWVDTSISLRSVISITRLTWFIRYVYYWN